MLGEKDNAVVAAPEIKHRFSEGLAVGRQMPSHAFTLGGLLLLARGECITSDAQLDRLLQSDVILSNNVPAHLAVEIQRRTRPLVETAVDTDVAVTSPLEEVVELTPVPIAEAAPETVSFAEETETARKLQCAVVEQVAGQMERVRAGLPVDISSTRITVRNIMNSLQRNERALTCLLKLRRFGEYAYAHSLHTMVYSIILGRRCGNGLDLHALGMGALLHDIGKALLPQDMLQKPDALSATEWELMRTHPTLGCEILQRTKDAAGFCADAIGQHHERLDGSGYPASLTADQISLPGRIVAIADTYDAMTSNRPYKKAIGLPQATRVLSEQSGIGFDANLVRMFVSALGVFPIGSLVRLSTNELAVVVCLNPRSALYPVVLIISDAQTNMLREPYLLDMSSVAASRTGIRILGLEEPAAYGIDIEAYLVEISEADIAQLRQQSQSANRSADSHINVFA
jgi:putative nucleotidyltransferase with HDIG domain